MTSRRERDLADLRDFGFSDLAKTQQQRLLASGDYTPQGPKTRRVHDLVGLDGNKYAGRTFEVIKVNQVTYLLRPLDGGLNVKASKELVTDPPNTQPGRHVIIEDVPIEQHLVAGTIVRINGLGSKPAGGLKNGGLGVVLVDKGDRINVAKLGGFEDRYGRLPRRMITVVDPKEILLGAELGK